MSLDRMMATQEERLMSCVHCGFCLPACPTYVRLGDEADSPRGRLYLMKAVVEGRLDTTSDAFQTHIDRCLGCRACETVCPSGVEYGLLLEWARSVAREARPPGALTSVILRVFSSPAATRLAMLVSRIARATGVPALVAKVLPAQWRITFAAGMLAATAPNRGLENGRSARASKSRQPGSGAISHDPNGSADPVQLLEGCVQSGLFAHVNRATERVLTANGYRLEPARGQRCCGALHAHAGDLEEARRLARANIRAFENDDAPWIVVNAAGCGATMKEYGELLADDPEYADRARVLSARVRDVSELLTSRPIREGAAIHRTVAYDAPCHLHHGQRIVRAPLEMLAAVPGLVVTPVRGASECCGGAGIYGLTHPRLGGRIGSDKVDAVREADAPVLVTGNPGCMMQIGAGLRTRGIPIGVSHPVELLDESYRTAGYYD